MDPIREELERRWQQMLERAAAGDDLPPALRLRTEGLMEALVLAGAVEPAALSAAMAEAWRQAMGEPLAATLGDDWESVHPFPAIPFYQARAPVVPSTGDD
ncbi:hypothetical protein [Pseudohaliea sp.]|uniref:hypothetical protein n=1 Tax=Pseudohaliea sp. TaxID=2740289 RepID=UPI0032EDE785